MVPLVSARVTIDNAQCAITEACAQDPTVQRAYAKCAEGMALWQSETRISADCQPHRNIF